MAACLATSLPIALLYNIIGNDHSAGLEGQEGGEVMAAKQAR